MAKRKSLPVLHFKADPDAAQPLYQQLSAALLQAIQSGRIAIGTRLPSERLYAGQLGLSRTTVTAAYQELKDLGLVRGRVGHGAVVAADDPDQARAETVAWSSLASPQARVAAPSPSMADRGAISFGDGWLHESLIPDAALTASALQVMKQPDAFARAAPVLGLPALREALVDKLGAEGIKVSPEEVLVTGGAQQGLNIVARSLIAPGDVVVCESPTWHGAFRAFRTAGAQVVGVRMDHEGIDPDALEDAMVRLRPKFVYLIPSFHCPTGRYLGLSRRRRILDICLRLRTPIVESQVYGDLAFAETAPSLKALDTAGIVIQQGSASKTISAALRLGWLAAPRAPMDLFASAKATLDLSTPVLPQAVLSQFMAGGAYGRHLAQLRKQLKSRRDRLLAALSAQCPELRVSAPQGGLYLWAQLPRPLQAHDVEAAAAIEGLSIRSGSRFHPDGESSSHIRLCYAAPALEQIDAGAQRLGQVLRRLQQRHSNQEAKTEVLAPV